MTVAVFACVPPPTDMAEPALYHEPHRPLIHFSPAAHWMNDPNGMVYFEGEYHLFYQYYPDSTVWGPMHWGHAISTDLVTWEHRPIALYPDSLGYIFSGSAVVDWNNTSGFQTGDTPPLVAIFTYHDPVKAQANSTDTERQGIAYSTDKGRTWVKYEQNPVLPNPGIRDFRDPKVMWHDASNQWVMTLAAKDHIHFYGSPNLKDWEFLSEFGATEGNHGGVWECPDLFPLTAPDGAIHWVLIVSIGSGAPNGGSGTQYFLGSFDGTTFTNTNPPETELWIDWGRDNYAGVTWSDIPAEDGRRIFLGWMSNWAYAQVVPTERWRSAMTLPRTLHLADTSEGLRLTSQPIAELQQLRTDANALPSNTFATEMNLMAFAEPHPDKLLATPLETLLTIDLATSTSTTFGLELANTKGEVYRFGIDRANQHLFSDRTEAGPLAFSDAFATQHHVAPYTPAGDQLQLHAFIDQSSIEVFIDDGQRVMTELFFPSSPFTQARLFSAGGETVLTDGVIHRLDAIWK